MFHDTSTNEVMPLNAMTERGITVSKSQVNWCHGIQDLLA
jgi:hypothetical protein